MNPKIKHSFWTDGAIEEQPPEIKLTALWLITNSTTSALGVCEASPKRFTFETGLDCQWLARACEALPRMFVVVGKATFIRNYIRYQVGDGNSLTRNNFFKTILFQLRALKDLALKEIIIAEYPLISSFLLDEKTKGLPSPKAKAKAKVHAKEKAKAKAEEGECKGEGKTPELKLEVKTQNGSKITAEEIYEAYPRKVARPKATEAIKKQLVNYAPEFVLERTKLYAATPKNPTFIPHPATWFNQERFADDPQTWANLEPRRNNGNGNVPVHKKLEAINALLMKHPCNPESACATHDTTQEEKDEYQRLKANKRTLMKSMTEVEQ